MLRIVRIFSCLQVSWGVSLLFSNLWLFSPLMQRILARSQTADPAQRTTTAVTIIQGGYKENVIPGSATAIINHRIHPADTLEKVIEHSRRIINDPRVQIKVVNYQPPTPISPYGPDVGPFVLIARSIKQIYPTSIIAPGTAMILLYYVALLRSLQSLVQLRLRPIRT